MIPLNPRAEEMLQEISTGKQRMPPMWALAGIISVEAVPGCVTLFAQAGEQHLNAFGGIHGGYAATLLDTALGLTVFISIDEKARHSTVDLSVKIVKPVPTAGRLVVKTELVHVSRSLGVSQGVLKSMDDERLLAHGTTTCHIKRLA